jgi:glutamate N-acetyltransferase/amino-acid N-acetyltransferase
MTTDTSPKIARARAEFDGRTCTVAGVAKGAGMIHPNMATLLVVLLTDARVDPGALDTTLRESVERSFHRITVDGDTSTNDTTLALASGAAGEFPGALVQDLMTRVARTLALKVVRDGEGARKLLHVRVREARDTAQALRVARTLAGSLLVRTALAGGDPNWGRIVAAIARSGENIDLARLRVLASSGEPGAAPLQSSAPPGAPIWQNGAQTPDARAVLTPVFGGGEAVIDVHLGQGSASDEFFSCDLTEEYVRINASYST